MDWMAIVIICLVVAMVVGPVMIMQPTKRQRRLAHLRSRAAAMGMRVQMEKSQNETYGVYQKSWSLTSKERRRVAPWRVERMPYAHGLHLAQYWQINNPQALSATLRTELDQTLARVPPGVAAVEVTADGVRCFWDERGGEQALEAVSACLDELIAIMVPFVRRRPGA